MKINKQSGFIPLIVALIIALSLGGGVIAYRAQKHNQESKIESESRIGAESNFVDSKLSGEAKDSNLNTKGSLRIKGGEDYGENHPDLFGGDGEEDDDDYRVPKTTPTPVVIPPNGTTVKTYALADIRLHNTRASCWTVVNGTVYDVTSWISQHPGGSSAILSMCGVDGSSAFNGQHGGQSRPTSELASFKIGILK